jgi:hypothetical protein
MQSFSKMPIELGAALGINGYGSGTGSGTGNGNGSPNGSRSPQSVRSSMRPAQGRTGKILQGDLTHNISTNCIQHTPQSTCSDMCCRVQSGLAQC